MGERGPKTKPAELHLLHGNPSKKNLGALLDDVVRPDVAIPDCPTFLKKEARAEWLRITPHLEQLGLISQIDRAALVGYCDSWGDYAWACKRIQELNADDKTGERGRIWDTPSGYKQISVVQQIKNRALEQCHKFLAEFGMSPAARARVTASDPQLALPGVPDKPTETGWAAFPKQA